MLEPGDFEGFFKEIHGVSPFPWQERLLKQIASEHKWPGILDLPTGAGKTAAIDIALFHLALEAGRGEERRAPVRIAFVVDRRLVVDDAYGRACKLADTLRDPPGPITKMVAKELRLLSLDGPPLLARRLRGGIPREDDWARTPAQPTILCSTVDQIGSRLLFRGYGISDSMKPVHAGLVGADSLILLDEAHLAEPFRQTLAWAARYRSRSWREKDYTSPSDMALLTATPDTGTESTFPLNQQDRDHPVLQRRLEASKPASIIQASDEGDRQRIFIENVRQAIDAGSKAIGVVSNRVMRARQIFEKLHRKLATEEADVILLIGPARPAHRDLTAKRLTPIRTGAERSLDKPLIIVATQCIEAGVDIDLDALFTEAAPLDCLRQRFGRLNRDGRNITTHASIVAIKDEIGARSIDPVYGDALREAWKALDSNSTKVGKSKASIVDFGLAHFAVPMTKLALSHGGNAPVLMPAHLDLLSQTSPIPAADPDVALYLHGPSRQPDAITVIWRADVTPEWQDQDMLRLLALVPPRSGEAIELPLWAARHWLSNNIQDIDALADVASAAPETTESHHQKKVFRWSGLDDRSRWVSPNELRSGDTIIAPSSYGWIDDYGWCPGSKAVAADLADNAAEAYRGRRFALRLAPGLLGKEVTPETLSETLASLQQEKWGTVRDAVSRLALPDETKSLLTLLTRARNRRGQPAVETYFDLYGSDREGKPRGVVFFVPHGLEGGSEDREGRPNATEDDTSGSLYGFAQTLAEHSSQVEAKAEAFARAAGLPNERINDIKLAGLLHDEGKRDIRFQRWLHHGDPLGSDPDDESTVLAKSGRALPPNARDKAGLPPLWRHEALSVRLARAHAQLGTAADPDLVIWLVGTHHGFGRPLFPHADPIESAPDIGPQSLAFTWDGMDWPTLFQTLKVRYGVWELARMEAILRLADHRASEEAARSTQ